jgi:hypothetical protein
MGSCNSTTYSVGGDFILNSGNHNTKRNSSKHDTEIANSVTIAVDEHLISIPAQDKSPTKAHGQEHMEVKASISKVLTNA